MFVDRTTELALLQGMIDRGQSELLLLYGRRRIGGIPWSYWMAQKELANLQRRRMAATIRGRPPSATGPTVPS